MDGFQELGRVFTNAGSFLRNSGVLKNLGRTFYSPQEIMNHSATEKVLNVFRNLIFFFLFPTKPRTFSGTEEFSPKLLSNLGLFKPGTFLRPEKSTLRNVGFF